jgi:AcrR family transcriptional regulator
MAQIAKPHVREAILRAAALELARAGYDGMTLASVATSAGTSIGNLYKYFANKDDLFAATVPEELVRTIGALFGRRIEALGGNLDPSAVSDNHAYRAVSDELLELAIARRHELLFLLRHARGTAYASFADDLARSITKHALAWAERVHPVASFTALQRRALLRVYRSFLVSIASILEEESTRSALQAAVAQLTTYHLAGLRAYFESAAAPAKAP